MANESPKQQISGSEAVRQLPDQRVERKAPWEPRRVEGDAHVMATCGFTATLLYGGQRVPP